MKKNELVQIKGLDLKELRLKSMTIKSEIASLVFDKEMKKLKDLKALSKKRKDLAQVLTLIRQKELLDEIESRVNLSTSLGTGSQESGKETDKPKRQRKDKTGS